MGTPMFILCRKLKILKVRLKQLNRESFCDITNRTAQARSALTITQDALALDPLDIGLANIEKEQLWLFLDLRIHEESFFKQKSRIKWLNEGDLNTKYFHHFVSKRHHHNRILLVSNNAGAVLTNPIMVQHYIVSHFQNLLGPNSMTPRPHVLEIQAMLERTLDVNQTQYLSRQVTDIEIRNTMFSLAKCKAPGPDGFNVDFFKDSWDIVGPSVTLAIKDFFGSGLLLKETNNTILTLVPKAPNASAMNDFRPIACCNTVYKCITKILANRMASVLPSIISPRQNAFVKGRRISDNILLAQELFVGFLHEPYLLKCAIKVDFQKAYDTIDWGFLELVLQSFGFPELFTKLIMACVTSPKFSVAINGELHEFFASGRGICQGDPMSPYLFTLVMEVFTGILNAQSRLPGFKYYWRCKVTSLSHLFFADDVLLFAEANMVATGLLKDGLDLFSGWSSLKPNVNKSEIYFSGGSVVVRE